MTGLRRAVLRAVVSGTVVFIVMSTSGCSAVQWALEARGVGAARPFSARFGVDVGDISISSTQLDALGPVWYMDYRWSTPNYGRHERLHMIWDSAEVDRDPRAIVKGMQTAGASWWSLGNEPNDPNQDNVSAEEYARLYRVFEQLAGQARRCHIVAGGIGNADWRWAAAFREAYRAKYGRYPRVDAWSIHNYILDVGLDPYDVAEFQRRIEAFASWKEGIGDGHKPLFLTEFGVLYGSGCCDRPVDAPERIQSFMRQTVDWLVQSEVVSCWAWFATQAEPFNGSLMSGDGTLNELGVIYRDLASEDAGQSRPSSCDACCGGSMATRVAGSAHLT